MGKINIDNLRKYGTLYPTPQQAIKRLRISVEKFNKASEDLNKSIDKAAGALVRFGQPFKAYYHTFFPNEMIK